MVELGKWANVIRGTVEDESFAQRATLFILAEWEPQREVVEMIVSDFELMMSPRTIVGRLELRDTGWLQDVTHCLWKARYPVSEWVRECNDSIVRADAAFLALRNALSDVSVETASSELLAAIEAFRMACRRLGSSIQAFPDEVRPM